MFCHACRGFFQRNKKAARWAAFFIGLALFFFWLGSITAPVYAPGLCRVYP